MKNKNHGFTLVETIVTLVILAILAAVAIPTMRGYIDTAKGKSYIPEAKRACTAVQGYIIEQYSNQNLDAFELYEDLIMYKLGETGHALNTLLEGSYTPGAWIKSVNFNEKTARFYGITYQVDDYTIEIKLRDDVQSVEVRRSTKTNEF